jgi:uncharacterized membrane protein YfcA
MFTNQLMVLVAIGLLSGLASGIFGIGGGVILVPALIYLAGFSQHRATGTSLAVLLPPIGLAATVEYYVHGNVDIRAAFVLAATIFIGAWIGAFVANHISAPLLRLIFALFLTALGCWMSVGALRRIGWI